MSTLTPEQRRIIDALRDRRGMTLDLSRPIIPATSLPTEPATAVPVQPGTDSTEEETRDG